MANAGPDTNKAQVRRLSSPCRDTNLSLIHTVLHHVCETDEPGRQILHLWQVSQTPTSPSIWASETDRSRVIDGADSTLDQMERVPVNPKNRPLEEIKLNSVCLYISDLCFNLEAELYRSRYTQTQ
jgi:hypothetical protein